MRVKRLHPFNYMLLSLTGIAGIFCSHTIMTYVYINILMLANLLIFERKINWKALIIFIITLLPTLLAFYISSRLFANDISNVTSTHMNSSILSVRLFSLAIVSFMYILHLPKEQFVLNLIQRKILSVNIGFALLAVFNAFAELRKEFNKIRLAYKMRFAKNSYSPKILLPLMVSAARYAHTLSISMYTRGINQNRSYYMPKIQYKLWDMLMLLLNIVVVIYFVKYK